ncbi:MAG: ATP-binding protein [Hyphomicrobiaceae bacterium]
MNRALSKVDFVVRERRPQLFGLAAKVLVPITVLTLLAGILGGLVLREEYKSHQASIEQKKAELVWRVRTLYEANRSKLLDVAKLLANNPNVQNGLLIGDQYNPLNSIMNFLGHSDIDTINLYDLDGRAFARAQSPSYFGDYDELSPIVRAFVAASSTEATPPTVGIITYGGSLALVAIRLVRGVSGASGVIVVGQLVTPKFLATLAPANHTAITIDHDGRRLVDTDVRPLFDQSRTVYEEHGVAGGDLFRVELLTNDSVLFNPFWGARASILLIAALAAVGSVIVTFVFMFMTVVRPVRHLIAIAEQQVSGDLTARVELDSRDELGRLGDILNLLTGNLKTTLENRDRINEQLEGRVAQRTDELERELVERERAQAALLRAKEDAEAANASKSRFLAAASHDLRQPVHAMTLFVSNLAEQVDSPKARRTVANLNACVETLCEMFENILDVSKLASGVIKPQTEEFPIDRLIGRLQREFEGLSQAKGIELRSVRSSLMLRSDPVLLHRILGNLVSNALKNTREGRVLIGCRRRGPSAEIQIWDTGVGIPKADIAHIFDEFYRGASTSEKDTGFGAGLGLGLSIVEHTAKLLDLVVDVSSTPGRQTLFSVTVPRALAVAVDGRTRSEASYEVSGVRVLVVDDDALALGAVQATLEGWGCIVAARQSSDDALKLLAEEEPPKVLIIDYLLQNGETGIALLDQVEQGLGLSIPSIILSGVSSRLLEREANMRGYQLLYKPTQSLRLRQAIARSIAVGARRSSGLPTAQSS